MYYSEVSEEALNPTLECINLAVICNQCGLYFRLITHKTSMPGFRLYDIYCNHLSANHIAQASVPLKYTIASHTKRVLMCDQLKSLRD